MACNTKTIFFLFDVNHNKKYMTEASPFLELSAATVKKDGHNILNKLDLLITTREQTAIIGPNGSGKSTLIKLLTRQLYARESKEGPPPVKVFGKERWNVGELRSKMGIVSNQLQRDFLNNTHHGHISGQDVVISGFFSSLRLFPHQNITEKMRITAREALKKMESEHLADFMLDEMSTGEVQRVLIARALVNEPQVRVLDEPTTGLDLVARYQCMTQIRKLAQNGTSIVLVTHHVDEIFPEVERLIFLKDGNIAYNGSKKELLTSKHLSDIYDHPLELKENKGFYQVGLK